MNRKAYIPTLKEMPSIGYVAVLSGRLIAAVFLRKVEGGIAQIDTLVSNPTSTGEERHCAIDLVVEKVLEKAKKLNINGILFTSEDSGTIMRSHKYGFKKTRLTLMAVDLKRNT